MTTATEIIDSVFTGWTEPSQHSGEHQSLNLVK
jgi:hypothetical protein